MLAYLLSALAVPAAPAPAPASAAAPSPAPAHQPQWVVAWRDNSCLAIRASGSPMVTSLLISRLPGSDTTIVSFVNAAWTRSPLNLGEKAQLLLDPGGREKADGNFMVTPGWFGPALTFSLVGREFPARLAAANAAALRTDASRELATVTIPSLVKVLAEMRRCEEDALRQWGIDPNAWAALRSGPVPDRPVWQLITSDDYPAEALEAEASGTVTAKLTVAATGGKAIRCAPVGSSGNKALDRQTCAILMQRARFTAAVDASGRNAEAPWVTSLAWLIHG